MPRDGSVHVNVIEGQVMTKNSKDRDAAWDVLRWIGGEGGQRRIASTGRMCNVPDTIRKFWLPAVKTADFAGAETFVKAIEGSTFGVVGELGESALDREAQLSAMLALIRDGRATAKEAIQQLQPRLQRTLDSFWAAHAAGR